MGGEGEEVWVSVCKKKKVYESVVEMFKHDHRSSYTLIFISLKVSRFLLFSKESKPLHSHTALSSDPTPLLNIDYLPPNCKILYGYSHGLLLLKQGPIISSKDGSRGKYVVCDPVARRYTRIPDPPSFEESNGLVCDNQSGDFTIVNLADRHHYKTETEFVIPLEMYCSKKGKWETCTVVAPRACGPWILWLPRCLAHLTSNGVLHFPQFYPKDIYSWLLWGLFVLRPSDTAEPRRGGFIRVPPGFNDSAIGLPDRAVAQLDMCCLGLYKGRLRLAQCIPVNKSYILKIWELRYDDDRDIGSSSWVAVCDGMMRELAGGAGNLCIKAFHPNKGSAVFLVNNFTDIYEYDFVKQEYSWLGPLAFKVKNKDRLKDCQLDLKACTLLHPSSPRPLPRSISY